MANIRCGAAQKGPALLEAWKEQWPILSWPVAKLSQEQLTCPLRHGVGRGFAGSRLIKS